MTDKLKAFLENTIRNLKTVPFYYRDELVGSAEIETVKNATLLKEDGTVFGTKDVWLVDNIKINKVYKMYFVYPAIDHQYDSYVIINRENYEGVAVTFEYPNKDLVYDSRNMLFSISLSDYKISYVER